MIVDIILCVLLIIFIYISGNLFRKLEKMEEVVEEYQEWINRISLKIEDSNNKLKQVDSKGTFESDDEVGFFFKSIQNIQEELNEITNQLTGDK